MAVVSVINYKGGVGKTTLTANVGAELANRGRTVLLIDLDPQSSLTFSFSRLDQWERELEAAGAADADVLHLHHLTPMNEAATRTLPDVPVVGHLHGTEVLMLREIEQGPPAGWDHAEAWAERMRRWAQACERLLVLSRDAVERAEDLGHAGAHRTREGQQDQRGACEHEPGVHLLALDHVAALQRLVEPLLRRIFGSLGLVAFVGHA